MSDNNSNPNSRRDFLKIGSLIGIGAVAAGAAGYAGFAAQDGKEGHGGEAETQREAVIAMPSDDRAALIRFLESL